MKQCMKNGHSIAKMDFIAAEMGGCTVWLVHPLLLSLRRPAEDFCCIFP